MEILIVGALVVALMVFISTKIKRSAAEAYVPETLQRDDFIIAKPEGFLTPIERDSEYAFEAYSRDYGEKRTKNVWQAHALLIVKNDLNFEEVCAQAKKNADKIMSERFLENENGDGGKVFLLECEKRENDIAAIEFRKIVESRARGKIYDLRVSVLPPFREIYIDRVNEMINSFQVKFSGEIKSTKTT